MVGELTARTSPARARAPRGSATTAARNVSGSAVAGERSESADVLGLGALGALGDVELDTRVILEGLEPGAGDRGVVDEDVSASAILCDEAEALVVVEPLDGSLRHFLTFGESGAGNLPSATLKTSLLRLMSSEPNTKIVEMNRDRRPRGNAEHFLQHRQPNRDRLGAHDRRVGSVSTRSADL